MPDDFLGLQREQSKWPRAATFLSVIVTLTLLLIKLFTWQITGSVAILGALVVSNRDLTTNIAAFWATRRADNTRIAPQVRWFVQILMTLAMAFLGWESVRQLYKPVPLENGGIALPIMLCCLCLKILLMIFQTIAIRHAPSSFIVKKDQASHKGSLLLYVGVTISIVLSVGLGVIRADAIAGIAAFFYCAVTYLKMNRRTGGKTHG